MARSLGRRLLWGSRWMPRGLAGVAAAGKERRKYIETGVLHPQGQVREVTVGQMQAFYCTDGDENETCFSGLLRR